MKTHGPSLIASLWLYIISCTYAFDSRRGYESCAFTFPSGVQRAQRYLSSSRAVHKSSHQYELAQKHILRPQYMLKTTELKKNALRPIHDLSEWLSLLMKRVFSRRNILQLATVLLSTALIFVPLKSNASKHGSTLSSNQSSVEYYLQNNPRQPSSSEPHGILSIQTQSPSTLASSPSRHNTRGRITQRPERKTTQRIAAGFVVASLAAASFRAKLRKTKVVRTATPFGMIRNTSPLGNGVSVIRLRMAFEFGVGGGPSAIGAGNFLEKLHIEEYNLYATIARLQQQRQLGVDVYESRQKALAKYLSSVASIFNQNKQSIRYGSMVSARVPFVEEAVTEFRSISERERLSYSKSKQLKSANNDGVSIGPPTSDENRLVMTSIVLTIKGDHTTSPFQSGVSTRKDMGRALLRIATDAQVDNCLVGTEVMWMPQQIDSGRGLSETEIMKKFPDVLSLS